MWDTVVNEAAANGIYVLFSVALVVLSLKKRE